MEQPYLPKGVVPNDIYNAIQSRPWDSLLLGYLIERFEVFDMGVDDLCDWMDYYQQEKEKTRLAGIQADKEWALTELLLRGKHGTTKTA